MGMVRVTLQLPQRESGHGLGTAVEGDALASAIGGYGKPHHNSPGSPLLQRSRTGGEQGGGGYGEPPYSGLTPPTDSVQEWLNKVQDILSVHAEHATGTGTIAILAERSDTRNNSVTTGQEIGST